PGAGAAQRRPGRCRCQNEFQASYKSRACSRPGGKGTARPLDYWLNTWTAAAASPKSNNIWATSLTCRQPAPGFNCSGTITVSPGISTMLAKPPDQKLPAASLLTTAPLARTT